MSNSASMNDLWYIVLHGGDDGIGDNIWSYDTAGNLVSGAVLDHDDVLQEEVDQEDVDQLDVLQDDVDQLEVL